MLTEESIKVFQTILTISKYTCQCPFTWKNGQLTFPKNKNFKLLWKWYIIHIYFWIYSLFLIVRIICIFKCPLGSILKDPIAILPYLMWMLGYISMTLLNLSYLFKAQEICLLFNLSVQFWRNYSTGSICLKSSKRGNIYYLLLFWNLSCLGIPIIFPIVFWVAPCSPQFIFFMIFGDKCSDCSVGRITILKIGFYLLEVILFFPGAGIVAFICPIMLIPLLCCTEVLQKISKFTGSNFGCHFQHETHLYRQAQLLINLFNECFKTTLIPLNFILHAAFSVMCLFAIIEFHNVLPLTGFIIYPFALLLIIVFDLVTMEYASKPKTLSVKCKQKWGKFQYFPFPRRSLLLLQKFSRSSPILIIYTTPKLHVGRERLAIFVRFCLQRTLFCVVYHRRMR